MLYLGPYKYKILNSLVPRKPTQERERLPEMGHSSIEGHLENRLIWRLDSIKSAKNKEQYFKNSKIFKRKGKCFVDHFLCVAFLSY